MIFVIIMGLAILVYLAYEMLVINRLMNEHESRVMNSINKAIDKINVFIIGIFVGLWNWNDEPDEETND